jgi:hypothetical protein
MKECRCRCPPEYKMYHDSEGVSRCGCKDSYAWKQEDGSCKCSGDLIWKTGKCRCPEDYLEVEDGYQNVSISERYGWPEEEAPKCVCKDRRATSEDGATCDCPLPMYFEHGRCNCPQPYYYSWTTGKCECPSGMEDRMGTCACPGQQELIGGRCRVSGSRDAGWQQRIVCWSVAFRRWLTCQVSPLLRPHQMIRRLSIRRTTLVDTWI